MSERRGLGWIPDVPKPNDYTASHPQVAALLKKANGAAHLAALSGQNPERATAPVAPPSVDLRQWFSPIEDQGGLGSCTANAAVALLEYFERRAAGRHVDASRLFVYKAERDLLGWKGDTGAYLRTAMETLVTFGAPPEKYWPYDGRGPDTNTRFDVEPSAFCYAFGQSYKAIKYFRLDPDATPATQVLANIKAFAAAGFPSMFGFPVYDEYMNPLPGALIPFPKQGSHYFGGHANVVAGYDDEKMIGHDKGALLVRNSWNTDWGDQGYGWMSYRYVTAGYAADWWSMVSADWIDGQFST
jgi:C1A family cysteine protease